MSSPRRGSLPMDLTDDFCPPRPELHAAFCLRVVVSRSYGQLGSPNLMSALACTSRRLTCWHLCFYDFRSHWHCQNTLNFTHTHTLHIRAALPASIPNINKRSTYVQSANIATKPTRCSLADRTERDRCVMITGHFHLVPKLRNSGALPPLPHTCSWQYSCTWANLGFTTSPLLEMFWL